MEKNANYFVTGLFVSLTLVGLVVFVIWLAGFHRTGDYDRYTIYFTEPVSGLDKEGAVKYKGVAVGKILAMRLDPNRSDLVKVDIEVERSAPIHGQTSATIEMQGITGLSYLELLTEATDQTPPPRMAGEQYPVLQGKGNVLGAFLDELPKVSKRLQETLTAVDELSKSSAKTTESIRALADTLKEGPFASPASTAAQRRRNTKMNNRSPISRSAVILPVLAALALTGCISLPGGDKNKTPTTIYTLHPPSSTNQQVSTPAKAAMVILVPKPELPKGFDTERITLLFEQSRRLDYYADAKWSARLDDLLQDFIAQMISHVFSGRVVATTDATAAAQHKLTVKITDFQPVYQATADSPPRLDVAMTVTLAARPDETVAAQFSLQKSMPASANTMTIVTKELEAVLQSLTEEMLQKIAPFL